jgi:hypothetical protein
LAIGTLGNVTTTAGANVSVTGVLAVGQVGTVTVAANANVNLTGVRTVVRLNRVNVWSLIDPVQVPNWTEVAAA